MSRKYLLRLVPAFVALALLATACADDTTTDTKTSKTDPPAEVTEEAADHIPGSHDEEGEHDEDAEGDHDMESMDDGEMMDDEGGMGPEDFVGDFAGTWTNTTYGSTGAAKFNVHVAAPDVHVTIDLDGEVFGASDPAEEVLTFKISDGGGATIAQQTTTFGYLVGGIDSDGKMTLTGTSVSERIASVIVTGTVTPDGAPFTYTVIFADGTPDATGTWDMAKV